jgi:hypothetical protein
MVVEIPIQKDWTPKKKADFCTEVAFNELLLVASRQFERLKPTMGLMYLSDLDVTKQFQEACRAVLRLQGAEF